MYLTAPTPARCYYEFCSNTATFEVERLNRSGNPQQNPILWGWCWQHKHHAWSQRTSK